jgi:hypothetical protein
MSDHADTIRFYVQQWADEGLMHPDEPASVLAALDALVAWCDALENAARAVVEEWDFPTDQSPSATYFHDLVQALRATLAPAGERQERQPDYGVFYEWVAVNAPRVVETCPYKFPRFAPPAGERQET